MKKDVPTVCIVVRMVSHAQMQIIVGSLWYLLMVAGRVNGIVAYCDTYSTESGLSEADCIGEVLWDDETMSFQVTNRLSAESYEVLDECSVIGNIFDNPELLEV